jgi:two-component system response regulator TctD
LKKVGGDMRILLVEDTKDVGEAIAARLERIGHAVDWELDGRMVAELIARTAYDLIILDVMLPGVDGFTILQEMRRKGTATPVLVLTARSRVEDRVDALDLGADDYLVKPFDFRELEARVRALIRRNGGEATNLLCCGDITIDRLTRMVRVGDREVHLKRREMTLLEILSSRPGRVFGKEELLDRMFGHDEAPAPNAVELYVGRLRRKIEGAQAQIVTVRGFGYQMVTDGQK